MIDWNKINTVFLDMDGTLLDLHFDNYFWLTHLPQRYAEIKGVEPELVNKNLGLMFDEHHGSLNWYCLDFWTDSLDVDIVALKREVAGLIGYRPNAKQFLQSLNAGGFDVVLVTNAHQLSIDIKFEYTDLSSHLNSVICSHDFDMPKENTRFWHKLQRAKPFDMSRTVFIDDNDSVLASARRGGLEHLISIAKPDSRKAERSVSEFPLLNDFADIFPK